MKNNTARLLHFVIHLVKLEGKAEKSSQMRDHNRTKKVNTERSGGKGTGRDLGKGDKEQEEVGGAKARGL